MKRNRLIRKQRIKLIRAGLRPYWMGKSDFQVQQERLERVNTELYKIYKQMEDPNLLPYAGLVAELLNKHREPVGYVQ